MKTTELYASYAADITDAPTSYAQWMGYFLISCVLNKSVSMSFGVYRLYPNFYLLLIGPSSVFRKSYSQKIALSILKEIYPDFRLFDVSSQEAFVSEIARKDRVPYGCGAIAIDEFGGFMRKVKGSKHFSEYIEKLSSVFDHNTISRRVGIKEDEKETYIVEEPFLNLSATCSIDWLTKSIENSDVSGGFLSRFVWIYEDKKEGRNWSEPGTPDPVKHAQLLNRLNEIRDLQGEMKWTPDSKALWDHWYDDFRRRNQGGFWDANYERMTQQVRKVAMINAAQELRLDIRHEDLKDAIGTIEPLLRQLNNVIIGDSSAEILRKRILAFIRKREPAGVSRSDLLNGISGLDAWTLDQHEKTLLQAEKIQTIVEETGGRKRTIYKLKNILDLINV